MFAPARLAPLRSSPVRSSPLMVLPDRSALPAEAAARTWSAVRWSAADDSTTQSRALASRKAMHPVLLDFLDTPILQARWPRDSTAGGASEADNFADPRANADLRREVRSPTHDGRKRPADIMPAFEKRPTSATRRRWARNGSDWPDPERRLWNVQATSGRSPSAIVYGR
jgi:hypothetical protein